MFGNETYETPEGFSLHRPLLLPDARSFADVLAYVREWDYESMSHRNGVVPEPTLVPAPRYIPATGRTRNEIGPFCSIDLSQIGGMKHRGIAVRATDAVIDAIAPRIVTPDDHLSFELIAHGSTNRVLVICQHGYIIGSHYVAYIDPQTIPAYPYAARDERKREICAAMVDAGHTPFLRPLPDGAVELSSRTMPKTQRAVVYADGSVERHWPDGTVSHEAAR